MDTAYDAIQQEALADLPTADPENGGAEAGASAEGGAAAAPAQTLTEEINDAMATFQGTAWGMKIGGLWETVRKQGEIAIEETKKDISVASELAAKELTMITEQVRTSTIASQATQVASQAASQASTFVTSTRRSLDTSTAESAARRVRSTVTTAPASTSKMFGVLKGKAQARLDELENVDLNKYFDQFGKDVKLFLQDAVTIAPGEDEVEEAGSAQVTKDVLFDVPEEIKRHIYTTRLDAQLHALHTSVEPFLAADAGDATYDEYAAKFSADTQTETIVNDLEHYPELRKLMEKLVPEKIAYDEFWRRYYFLREQINQEEARRKQLLTEAGTAEENFDWDEDEEEEEVAESKSGVASKASTSTETLKAEDSAASAAAAPAAVTESKPNSSRPSSESSYDLVSAANSQADLRAEGAKAAKAGEEEEEEEDWE
ncbi:hypothetical protein BZA70DRAFT_267024 [Myxozyma melibiosi]|uniref:BSD domain-containing protein n=1 Tax=Myxozyma melibiosi TaxID=54550 RepID=A0ABR1F7V5_9ASCO